MVNSEQSISTIRHLLGIMWVCATLLEQDKGLTVCRLATYLSSCWTSEQTRT